MKLVTFQVATPLGPARRLGALLVDQDGPIVDLNTAYRALLAEEGAEPRPAELADFRIPQSMSDFLCGGEPSMEAARQALEYVATTAGARRPEPLAVSRVVYQREEVRLLAPVPAPPSIRDYSVYEEHAVPAGGRKPPAWYRWPPAYKGNPGNMIGPEEPIPFPSFADNLDLEIELAFYVGKEGRDIPVEQAPGYIAGYTIFIDPSVRGRRDQESLGPFKSKDFCYVTGPCLVTPDEINPDDLRVSVKGNGELWFEGNTGHRRNFSPAQLLAYSADNEVVRPGDLIACGTIGRGCALDHGHWAQVGQEVEFFVEGIGTLRHRIVPSGGAVGYARDGLQGALEPPP